MKDLDIAGELLDVARELVAAPKSLRLKTVMDQGKAARKRQEREKTRYVSQVSGWFQRITGAGSASRDIAERLIQEIPGRNTGAVFTKRKNQWVKAAKQKPEIIEFTEYVGGPSRMYGSALYLVRDVVLGQMKFRDAKAAAQKMAGKWYVENTMHAQEDVFEEGGYEADFRDFLPPNISFKLGPTRDVQGIVESFGREKKNWETMARKLAYIAERFNDIVRKVKADMRSGDEITRLCALMTAITIETGLRPGEVGNMAKIKDYETGEEIEVETFGVTTMQKRHVKFIRDNFAELRFIGKKGTEQVAELSDADILKALKEAQESTSVEGDTAMLFVTKRGEPVGYQEMKKYVASRWGDITPTDFRKLKATRTFYEKLRKRAQEMTNELAKLVVAKKGKLKELVVAQIMKTLEAAAQDAQKALSHKDWKTTIKSYVDPRVVVNFLNQGGLDDTLEDILVNGKNVRLVFDLDAFVDRAKKIASPIVVFKELGQKGMSVSDILGEMDNLVENLI